VQILIVGDDKIPLESLSNDLSQCGYDVATASNGRQALSLLRDGSIRMVISDWDMPRMSGIELCRAIRSENLPGYVFVTLLAWHNSERSEALRAGADDFIARPFYLPELLFRVQMAERICSLETRDVALFLMARLAESRDPQTEGHLERVRSYSQVLAEHLSGVGRFRSEIDADFIRLIYLTSPLHDIGKVKIPDNILLKPGPLDDREFEIMKTHASLGAETLDAAARQFPGGRFLQMARHIAASHHERFDGTGYPQRMADDCIPLSARIVALADVYDALTSDRVYKEAFDHEVAWPMIVSEAGGHFDPDVVDAFVESEASFISIRNQFYESRSLAA
jgi:putative two-component system response regulator